MQYFSCWSDKCTEIKMCDLEPFSKIQSQMTFVYLNRANFNIPNVTSFISSSEYNHISGYQQNFKDLLNNMRKEKRLTVI